MRKTRAGSTESGRNIQTVFYQKNKVMRTNCSKHPHTSVKNAVGHLQSGRYDATHCEVYHKLTGFVYAVLKITIGNRKLEVLYKHGMTEVVKATVVGGVSK